MNPVCAAEVRENQQTDQMKENNYQIQVDANTHAFKTKYIEHHKGLLSLVQCSEALKVLGVAHRFRMRAVTNRKLTEILVLYPLWDTGILFGKD